MAFEYNREITIDSSQIDAPLIDYPVTVKLDETNFDFSKVRNDGLDISFDGLEFEREFFKAEPGIKIIDETVNISQGLLFDNIVSSAAEVTDGNTNSTYYVHGGLESDPNNPWITLDLGQVYALDQIIVWHYYADGRTYHKTATEVSKDGVNWVSVFDSSIEGEYQETSSGKTHTFKPIEARYVRDKTEGSTANSGNHWVEIQVFGSDNYDPEGVGATFHIRLPNISDTTDTTFRMLYSDPNQSEDLSNVDFILGDNFIPNTSLTIDQEYKAFINNIYYLIATPGNEMCYFDETNQSVVKTNNLIEDTYASKEKIVNYSFESIEEMKMKIDDLNMLKGYKIKVFNKTATDKVSLIFKDVSDIETIVPKHFIDTTNVNSFESIEIDNRGTFNVVFSNKIGEWCYFDETKSKVIITALNGEVDLLNSESDVLVNQSNNYAELENLLPEIYAYAKETEQIKLGVILPLDNEIKQVKIISNIEGSYQPLILGQDYTYNIKQNQVDVILSDTYDSNNKIRINLMK